MSGPITVIITGNAVPILLSAAAIDAALAIYDGYQNAAVLHQHHQDLNQALHRTQSKASDQGQQALQADADTAEAAFVQIYHLAEKLHIAEQVRATMPVRPIASDSIAVAAYIRALQALADALRNILLTEAAKLSEEFADMPEFALQAATASVVPQNLSQRLLARIAHLGETPQHIQNIAQELDHVLPGERADLLATELRAQIQAHIAALQKQQVQTATALIVSQSLQDLGYQVEAISDTLFVDGGVVHFRRHGWGNYMVRMRVDKQTNAVNFNVIRAVAEGENERSVLDHLAEDRWCSEFPALLQALEVRGVHMHVTRRLEAGELPVQLVNANKLPQFVEENETSATTKPLEKKLP